MNIFGRCGCNIFFFSSSACFPNGLFQPLSPPLQVPNFNNVTLPPNEQITAQEIDSYFRQELIYKRNERMGKRVKALLEEHPDKSFFFAFGAGRSDHEFGLDSQMRVHSKIHFAAVALKECSCKPASFGRHVQIHFDDILS